MIQPLTYRRENNKLMPFIFALVLTMLATPALIWAANRHGLLDVPDERKCHQEAIPLVGGLSMAFAVAVSAAWHMADASFIWGLFAAVSIIVMVGFVDDCVGLPVGVRFLAQAIASLIMALFADAQLTNLGDLFGAGAITLSVAALPFSIFAIVGLTNAVNMSDGMDGLAGGLALISTAFVAVAAYLSGGELTLNTLLILSGALIGFLYFNMRFPWQQHARVFMGDSGSLMLGFVLAWAVIRVTQTGQDALPPAAALWFFAVPLWDTVSLMLRRVCRGKSPFRPGRDHLHHILLRVGYTESQVVRFIHLVAVAFGLVGLGGWRLGVPDAIMLYGFLAVFSLYCVGVRYAWKLMRLIVPLRTHA